MRRKLSKQITWIQQSGTSESLQTAIRGIYGNDLPPWYRDIDSLSDIHTVWNAYLIEGEETLLFDTLPPIFESEIIEEVNDILDGQDLDYLVASHPEASHVGNTRALTEAFPSVTVLAPERGSEEAELYYLGGADLVTPGDTLDLGGPSIEFIEPLFPDHNMTIWMHEQESNTLFTVDWIAKFITEANRTTFVDELDHDLTPERLVELSSAIFPWFEYADVDVTDRAIEEFVSQFDDPGVAPAHGHVIREDGERYMRMMKQAVKHVASNDQLSVQV